MRSSMLPRLARTVAAALLAGGMITTNTAGAIEPADALILYSRNHQTGDTEEVPALEAGCLSLGARIATRSAHNRSSRFRAELHLTDTCAREPVATVQPNGKEIYPLHEVVAVRFVGI